MVILVISMVSLMGAAAFAIDVGAMWSTRRDIITAADAAALAAAADFAQGVDGCGATDDTYVAANSPNAVVLNCAAFGATTGRVEVTIEQTQQTFFGSVLGLSDTDVPAFSAAEWGYLSQADGLRPFGLCAATPAGGTSPAWLTQLQAWVANPSSPTTIQISYGKDVQTDPCNENGGPSTGAGNWGTVNLQSPVICAPAWDPGHPCPNGGASNGDLTTWTADGYERLIEPGTPGQNCVADAEHCWHGDTGANMNSNGARNALQGLIDNNTWFTLPLIDSASGSGSNLEYHIFGLVQVRLISYCFNTCSPGAPPPPPDACVTSGGGNGGGGNGGGGNGGGGNGGGGNGGGGNGGGGNGGGGAQCDWFIELEFAQKLGTGVCCNPTTTTSPVLGTTICAVDPTDVSGC